MIQRIFFTLTALVMVSLAADLPEPGSNCDPSLDSQAKVDPDDCTVFLKCVTNQDTGEGKWISSKCIDGTVYNVEKGRCDAYIGDNACQGYKEYVPPLPNVNIAARAIRPGCERVFQCPRDLQFFIYPDWNNCSNYNTCVQGIITSESCLTLGFPWYNPSSFACEQQINLNNVCFFRA